MKCYKVTRVIHVKRVNNDEKSGKTWLPELRIDQGIEKICSKDNTNSISLGRFLRMTPS